MNKLKKLLLISSALLLSTANNTFAGDSAATISASGTITGTCTFTASAMAFTLSTSTTTTATSNIVPTCTNGTAYTIKNTADSQYMSRSGASPTPVEGDDNTVGFTIAVTATSQAFTATNGAGSYTGKLTGTGNGSAQTLSAALTGTAESGAGKVAGIYAGTASLTIVY
jgi:spore coat protein U-like protein